MTTENGEPSLGWSREDVCSDRLGKRPPSQAILIPAVDGTVGVEMPIVGRPPPRNDSKGRLPPCC